jgi:hypothetical protein
VLDLVFVKSRMAVFYVPMEPIEPPDAAILRPLALKFVGKIFFSSAL